jgi:hypothetical protein
MRLVDGEAQILKFLNREVIRMGTASKINRQGLIERSMQELVSELTTMYVSTLCMRGILVSDQERTAIQRVIHGQVTGSVEINSAVVMNIERSLGPEAA